MKQLGRLEKHSRHLATLKESMSLFALDHEPEIDPEELFVHAVSAKNKLHQVKGYNPNQWAFGSDTDTIESWLQMGDHLPTQSRRNVDLTFEESLQRSQKAKEAFLKADARRRLLRAEKGKARRVEEFEIGQLVYFYRKGRNATSKLHPGWYGPARIVGIEKHSNPEETLTPGSIIWVSHATTLYRCAPEQLRKVTRHLQDMCNLLHPQSVFDDIRKAGQKANYHDIGKDLENEPMDSEIHEEEPLLEHPSSTKAIGPRPPGETSLIRARFKQPEQYRHVVEPRIPESEGHREPQAEGLRPAAESS